MAMLSPETDHLVRLAVDSYLAGHHCPQVEGEIFFSTRNHRYRLIDGVLFSVSHAGHGAEAGQELLGAEFVGWLHEDAAGTRVELGWRPGARAVLVDPRRRHHIIVTSNTRASEESVPPPRPHRVHATAGSMQPQVGSPAIHPPARVELTIPPPRPLPRPPHPPPRPIRQPGMRLQ